MAGLSIALSLIVLSCTVRAAEAVACQTGAAAEDAYAAPLAAASHSALCLPRNPGRAALFPAKPAMQGERQGGFGAKAAPFFAESRAGTEGVRAPDCLCRVAGALRHDGPAGHVRSLISGDWNVAFAIARVESC